jgi:hypothetical protein
MSVTRPYRRTCRQFADGSYTEGGRAGYIRHARYAQDAEHYVRAFLLIQQDLHRLFEFIEPADRNLPTYSFRTHELLLRTCVEVEANCKAILTENGYGGSANLSMNDYRRIDATHRLSRYEVILPVWTGTKGRRRPFAAWSGSSALAWYRAYNESKHDRHSAFEEATFDAVVDAICGLVVIVAAQFHCDDFAPYGIMVTPIGPADGDVAIGNYFRVVFPKDWPADLRYDFDWQSLQAEADPFTNATF